MSYRRNLKHLKKRKQRRQITKFLTAIEYGHGKDAQALVQSGWRPRKTTLDNYSQPYYTKSFKWADNARGIAAWKYLYEISTGDTDSSSVAQDSQVLGIAQNQGESRYPWFGERQSSSFTSVVGISG